MPNRLGNEINCIKWSTSNKLIIFIKNKNDSKVNGNRFKILIKYIVMSRINNKKLENWIIGVEIKKFWIDQESKKELKKAYKKRKKKIK